MPQTRFELNCFHLGSSSGLVRKAVASAPLLLVWPTPALPLLDCGSVPEDTEVSNLSLGVFNEKTLLSFLELQITTEMFRWTRKNNITFVGRANSGRPTRGPKMEKTNLVLEAELRTGRAQGAMGAHEPICSTCSALDLPSPESNHSPSGCEMSLCVARVVRPRSAA